MRGDQLVRHWRIIRAMEARPKGLIVAKTARHDGAQGTTRKRNPSKACPKTGVGFFIFGDRCQQVLIFSKIGIIK